MKFKDLFRFKYPKTLVLILAISFAYVIFSNKSTGDFILALNSFSYLGAFIAGLFFSFGFTAPFSAGFFIVSNPPNLLIAALVGGLGALIADLIIFSLVKLSFKDEFEILRKTKLIRTVEILIEKSVGKKIKIYLMYAFAGILIASPLPDEVGITMLAGLSHIKLRPLAAISFILNSLGILVLLYL